MKWISFLLLLLVYSCNQQSKQHSKRTIEETVSTNKDTAIGYLDYLKQLVFDTTTNEGKLDFIRNQVAIELFPMESEKDTLIDVNFDHKKDFIFTYFAQAGTGRKEGVIVYINNGDHHYIKDSLLSSIRNPSFFLKKKKITGYYLAHGGGECIELNYFNEKWNITKVVSVENHEENSKWICTFPEMNSVKTFKLPYKHIPPSEIIEVEKKHWRD